MVAARLLMVATTHTVVDIAEVFVSIYIPHETLWSAALRTGDLLLTMSRQLSVL